MMVRKAAEFMGRLGLTAALFAVAAPVASADDAVDGPYTETIGNALAEFEMVPVPGGKYTFADPAKDGAKAELELGPFWVSKTEVTWDLYDVYAFQLDLNERDVVAGTEAKIRPSMPYGAPDEGFGHQGYAALRMTLHAAQWFCQWLTRKTGHWYRLPTEAEWEYLASLDVDPDAKLDDIAWYWDNSDGTTHPVGEKPAGKLGLVDILGNVAEWCVASDGSGVVRGGSYDSKADAVGVTARLPYDPDWQMTDPQIVKSKWWLTDAPFLGLRVIRDPRPAPADEQG